MAINLNSEDSNSSSSPRLSFSHDLPVRNSNQTQEVDVIRLDMSLLSDQNSEFNFCASTCLQENESCPADELFYNGVIIPTQMKHKLNSINSLENVEVTSSTTATLVRHEKNPSKSFWRFRRSSSLNYENYGQKKSSSLWSMPLLFRSKSTGSSSSSSSSNYNPKQIQKSCSSNNIKLINNHSARFSAACSQKPPLRKGGPGPSGGGSTTNSLRNISGLNVPPPYITKGTSDLLGFSALFRNGSREKNKKK